MGGGEEIRGEEAGDDEAGGVRLAGHGGGMVPVACGADSSAPASSPSPTLAMSSEGDFSSIDSLEPTLLDPACSRPPWLPFMSMEEESEGGHDWSMLMMALSGSPKLSMRRGRRGSRPAATGPGQAYNPVDE